MAHRWSCCNSCLLVCDTGIDRVVLRSPSSSDLNCCLQLAHLPSAASSYRVLVSQTSGSDGVFSSDFLSALSSDFNNGTNSSSSASSTSLNRTYAGTTVPVDVYSVSSNVNASTLCSALTSTNSGTPTSFFCATTTNNVQFISSQIGLQTHCVPASDVRVAYAEVSYCEVDVQVSTDSSSNTSATPDDTLFSQQWDLPHVNAPLAWAAGYTGSPAVRVCMIDTGIDYTHPDIADNMWMNAAEVAGTGATASNGYQNEADDDGNGEHAGISDNKAV